MARLMDLSLQPTAVLLRFLLRSAVRVTLRNTTIQAALVFVGVGLTPEPQYLMSLAAGMVVRGESMVLVGLALWCVANAFAARGPLETAFRGWHRHLPLGRAHRRRAAIVAVSLCQGPVIGFALLLWLVGLASGDLLPQHDPQAVSFGMPLWILLVGPASALCAVRWRPAGATVFGPLMLLALVWGAIWSAPVALILLGLHDRWNVTPEAASQRRAPKAAASRWPLGLTWRLHWRALGPQTIFGAWLTAALPLASAWLFIRNNELQPWEETIGVRVGGALALIAVLLPLAGELRKRRPPWPWSRSLPWSSRRRLADDAAFLGAMTVPTWPVIIYLAPWAWPPLAIAAGFLSVRLATALRREQEGVTRLGAAAVGEVWVLQIMVAAWPWLAALLLASMPIAVRLGESAERSMKVSRWRERHHEDAADSGG